MDGKLAARCQIADKLFIAIRFDAAQLVINVEDGGCESELVEGAQQKNGIGAA